MSCPTPARIVQIRSTNAIKYIGKKLWDSYKSKSEISVLHEVPCQKCLSCRIAKKAEWAARIVQEATCHTDNCSLTLTYEDPPPWQLEHRDWQLFIKRLRKHLQPKKISFFMAGEYGDQLHTRRPHFHGILFNHNFHDLEYSHTNNKGNPIYTSPTLTQIWGKGITQVGPVNFDTAAYCASYVTKKIDGAVAEDYYQGRRPEYARCSKGIGFTWLKKYPEDAESGELHLSDRVLPVPRYYNKKLKQMNEEKHQNIINTRIEKGRQKNNRQLDKNLAPLKLAAYKAEILRLKHILGGKNEI